MGFDHYGQVIYELLNSFWPFSKKKFTWKGTLTQSSWDMPVLKFQIWAKMWWDAKNQNRPKIEVRIFYAPNVVGQLKGT